MSKYLSCAETAKLVRQALKEAFPAVKFSVRSSVYSGGASIDVRWTDGPLADQVDKVAKTFQGCYFDGMQDYKGYLRKMFRGEMVSFGANFIFTKRDCSDAAIEAAIEKVWTTTKFPDYVERPTVADYHAGRCHHRPADGGYYNLGNLIYQAMGTISNCEALPSPTAGAVIFLGNDGYSQIGALREVA